MKIHLRDLLGPPYHDSVRQTATIEIIFAENQGGRASLKIPAKEHQALSAHGDPGKIVKDAFMSIVRSALDEHKNPNQPKMRRLNE